MDGTLLEAAEYHWLTWHQALFERGATRRDRVFTRDQFKAVLASTPDEYLRAFLATGFPDEEQARVSGTQETRYQEMVLKYGIETAPGVNRWLARLHAEGWRQAVISPAPKANVEALLEALGIFEYFVAFAADEDGRDHGKPDPQVLRSAADALGLPPARCVVVDDARAGIEAGYWAGMRTIRVGAAHASLTADLTVASLDDLPDDAFDRLLDAGIQA